MSEIDKIYKPQIDELNEQITKYSKLLYFKPFKYFGSIIINKKINPLKIKRDKIFKEWREEVRQKEGDRLIGN